MNHIIWFIKLSNNVKKPAIFQKHYLYGVSKKLWCETGVRRTLIRNWLYMKYSDNIFDDYCGRSKAISKIQKRRQFRRSETCWWKCMHIGMQFFFRFVMKLQSHLWSLLLVTYGLVVLELKKFDVNRSVFILIELIWAGSVLFLVLVISCWLWHSVEQTRAWEYTYIANYRMRDEDMRETAGRGSASSDLSHWADSWTPLAAAPMIDGSPVSPFLLRRVTPNGRYTKVRELKEDFL